MEELQKDIEGFKILRLLGEGGMAKVYLAKKDGKEYALKLLTLNHKRFNTLLKRFHKEASLVSMLRHPNVIRLYEHGPSEGTYYLLMEHIKGFDLRSTINRKEKIGIAPDRAMGYIYQIVRALTYAHSMNIIHRDIKPANILIEKATNRAVLTDFGVAKMVESDWDLTATGMSVGTPNYMSPEQVLGDSLDGRTDIYAAGVMLYELLCGELPYPTVKSARQMQARLAQHPPKLPKAFQDYQYLVDNMIAPDREVRFKTSEVLLSAIEHHMEPDVLASLERLGTVEQKALDEFFTEEKSAPVSTGKSKVETNFASTPPTPKPAKKEEPKNQEETLPSFKKIHARYYLYLVFFVVLLPLLVFFVYEKNHKVPYFGLKISEHKMVRFLTRMDSLYYENRGFPPKTPNALTQTQKVYQSLSQEAPQKKVLEQYIQKLLLDSLKKERKKRSYLLPGNQDIIKKLQWLQAFFNQRLWYSLTRSLLLETQDNFQKKAQKLSSAPFESLYLFYHQWGEINLAFDSILEKSKESRKALSNLGMLQAQVAYRLALSGHYFQARSVLGLSLVLFKAVGDKKNLLFAQKRLLLWGRQIPKERASLLVGPLISLSGGCFESSSVQKTFCVKPFYLVKSELLYASLLPYVNFLRRNGKGVPVVFEQKEKYIQEHLDLPASGLSPIEIVGFLNWLNQMKVGFFRLPTEWEWEYASRGAVEQGANLSCSDCSEWTPLSPRKSGGSWENNLGFQNLLGNLWELTCSSPKENVPEKQPSSCHAKKEYIIRGGAFNSPSSLVKGGSRFYVSSLERSDDLGFRLVWLPFSQKGDF